MTAPSALLPDENESCYFGVRCKKCGWVGSSKESKGGNPTGGDDYTDITCPECVEDGFHGEVLEDATEAEICLEIVRLRQSRRAPIDARLREAAEKAQEIFDLAMSAQMVSNPNVLYAGFQKVAKLAEEISAAIRAEWRWGATICNPPKDEKTLAALGEMVNAAITHFTSRARMIEMAKSLSNGRPTYPALGSVSCNKEALIEANMARWDQMGKFVGGFVFAALTAPPPATGKGEG